MNSNKHRFILGIYTTVFLIITMLVFAGVMIYNNVNTPIEPSCKFSPPCINNETQKLDSIARMGKESFNKICVACHKLNVKSTGPALANIKPKKFWKWMDTIKTKNDTLKFEKLGLEYHRDLTEKHLKSEDLKNILEYINKYNKPVY